MYLEVHNATELCTSSQIIMRLIKRADAALNIVMFLMFLLTDHCLNYQGGNKQLLCIATLPESCVILPQVEQHKGLSV